MCREDACGAGERARSRSGKSPLALITTHAFYSRPGCRPSYCFQKVNDGKPICPLQTSKMGWVHKYIELQWISLDQTMNQTDPGMAQLGSPSLMGGDWGVCTGDVVY